MTVALLRTAATRTMTRNVVAAPRMAVSVRSYSKFNDKEKAEEDQYARARDAEKIKALKEALDKSEKARKDLEGEAKKKPSKK